MDSNTIMDCDIEIWDGLAEEFVPMPLHLKQFYKELNELYKKYNLSISHEDEHGSFIIKRYNDVDMAWLINANLECKVQELPEELEWFDEC